MDKAYTKNQMQIPAFFLGPLGAFYFLKKNFELLGNQEKAKNQTLYGILAVFGICLISPIIETSLVYLVINIAILIYIGATYEHEQKIELADKNPHSNWRVLGISLIGFAALVVMSVSITFIYALLGII